LITSAVKGQQTFSGGFYFVRSSLAVAFVAAMAWL
jgi:hypothetical protein